MLVMTWTALSPGRYHLNVIHQTPDSLHVQKAR